MKRILLSISLCFSILFLSGCQTKQTVSDPTVTKVGIIQVKSGDHYVFSSAGDLINITSTKYNLDNYLKKNISITGQYSGDTLYVGNLTETQ
jgi:hypothetical protein